MEPQRINVPKEKIIPNSQIVQGRLLGQGGYGRVYEANWNRKTVAVKRLMLEKMNQQAQSEFEHEINLHLKLSHTSVIRLWGIIAEEGQPYGMVLDYAAKGSLFNLLEDIKQSAFNWDKRKSIAMDVIDGLKYLHDNSIIHRDLKSLNVLLDTDLHALLADFGLSKVRSQTSSQSELKLKGTIQFLAPELLNSFRPKYDSKTDIYAYGMVLWELATHEIPYGDTKPDVILSLVQQGQREEFPIETNTPQDYQELTELCWAQKPDERPTVENIQRLLNKMNFGKSNAQTSHVVLVRNNSYVLDSNVLSKENSCSGYALNSETYPSKKSEQDYVLESEIVLPIPQIQQNQIKANYSLAIQFINQSRYLDAMPHLEPDAKLGLAEAQNLLGVCYKNAQGLAQNWAKAVEYFQLAAAQGHAEAQWNLGVCYYYGQGVNTNYAQAVKYLREAADQGHAEASNLLAFCFKNGKGIRQNHYQAAKRYKVAADQGHANAQLNLGACFYHGQGVNQDYAQAVKYFRLAASQGILEASNWLGVCYYYGHGVNQDYSQAVKNFQWAADKGHAGAQDWLGTCYSKGHGVKINNAQSIHYYQLAADQGDAAAQDNLGSCYYHGKGVKKDYLKAVKYYQLAANQSHASGQRNLAVCYHTGKGVKKDKTQAKYYYQLAANQGNISAKEALRGGL